MLIEVDEGDFELALFCRADGSGGLTLRYDAATRTAVVDKTGLDKRFNEAVFETLEMPLDRPLERLRIFVDHSSVEIFVNDGDAVFTSRVFPAAEEHFFRIRGDVFPRLWTMKNAVKEHFLI